MNTIERVENLLTVHGITPVSSSSSPYDPLKYPSEKKNRNKPAGNRKVHLFNLAACLDAIDDKVGTKTTSFQVGQRVRWHEQRIVRATGLFYFWLGADAEKYCV